MGRILTTILSTKCDRCNRVQRFSNEHGYYNNGKRLGDSFHDNARQINDVKESVAGYYTRCVGPPPTPPPTPRPTKRPTRVCIAGSTGFTKVEKGIGFGAEYKIKQLQDLQVGDHIIGMSTDKSKSDECEVVSVSSKGGSLVYGNYTSDHYMLTKSYDKLEVHGEAGEEGQYSNVFQVLSSCPIVTDESGKESAFSICGQSLYNNGPMPWSAYLTIHGSMFFLVKSTGLSDLSAFYDVNSATEYLPVLCTTGLICADSGECDEFESQMVDFVQKELVPEARMRVYGAFPQLGQALKEGSISFMLSRGKSRWGWYPVSIFTFLH